jgi:cytochrome P450
MAAVDGYFAALDQVMDRNPQVQRVGRTASADTILAGNKISAGDQLWIFLGASNRNPSVYPAGPSPAVRGVGAPHVACGEGRHTCLGDTLGPMEGALAFAGLLSLSKITLDFETVWADRRNLRALSKLPVLM